MDKSKVIVGLDIGTTSIKVIVAESIQNQLNVIGVGSERSQGLFRGVIVDIDKAAASIKSAVAHAEKKANVPINAVYAGIPANMLNIEKCDGIFAVGEPSREITAQDVAQVVNSALIRNLPPEREIVDVLPSEFIVDGFDGIKDPRGMVGTRLEFHGILFTAAKTVIHNTRKAVAQAGLQLAGLVINPMALGQLILDDGEADFGTIILDLGGGQSTAAVIHDHKLKFSHVDPEGGDYITKDISVVLNTTLANAERLKREYGNADAELVTGDDQFPVAIVGQTNPQMVGEDYLAEIIQARVEQILARLGTGLSQVHAFNLPGGIVVTGGVSALPGVTELVQKVYQRPVKRYIPDQMGLRHPSFAQGLSIVSYIAHLGEIDTLIRQVVDPVTANARPVSSPSRPATVAPSRPVPTERPAASSQPARTQSQPAAHTPAEPKKKKKKTSQRLKNLFTNFFD
ncbi:cell division protein FtsA [Schleiferilactobacillus harbinensis]|jgi:cell division protein FtsA|uniref:cell division protein FtsA n=1 Tax=Schleiferilactobacillus harbinensis TaxID=304207 RepID=UPI00243256A3|nr:cell division protein FtsA [Schleiferilactobacillus harbinensis]MCI1851729.1 cell division protein FtsA [Schleiferilactobacillus harbinensis]